MALTGREKATIFLSILGAEAASKILRYLPDDMADLLASGVGNLPHASPELLQEVVSDFKSFILAAPATPTRSLNAPQAQVVTPPPPEPELEPEVRVFRDPSEIVLEADPRRLASVLMSERPQIIAFLLFNFTEEKRQEILSNLPALRSEIQTLMMDSKPTIFGDMVKKQFFDSLAERFR
jgi:flagellar motor switch protein FliG